MENCKPDIPSRHPRLVSVGHELRRPGLRVVDPPLQALRRVVTRDLPALDGFEQAEQKGDPDVVIFDLRNIEVRQLLLPDRSRWCAR